MKQKRSDKKKSLSSDTGSHQKQSKEDTRRSSHPSVLFFDEIPDVEVDENSVILSEGLTENDLIFTWIDLGKDKLDRWQPEVWCGGQRGTVLTPLSKSSLNESQSLTKKSRVYKAKTPVPVPDKSKAAKRGRESSESRLSSDGNDGGVSRYGRQQKRKVNDDYVTAWQENQDAPEELPPPTKQLKISQSPKKTPQEKAKKPQAKTPVEKAKPPLEKVASPPEKAVSPPENVAAPPEKDPAPSEKVKTPLGKQQKPETTPSPTSGNQDEPLDAGDVVWARLGGFPFWPSVIVPDFKSEPPVPVRVSEGGKNQYHVLFLQDNGAHSWVAEKTIVRFTSPKIADLQAALKRKKVMLAKTDKAFKVKPSYQERWNKALEEAKQWYKKPAVERRAFYCPFYDEMIAADEEETIFKEAAAAEAELEEKKKKSLPPETPQEKPPIPKRKAQSLPAEEKKPKKIKAKKGFSSMATIEDSSSSSEDE